MSLIATTCIPCTCIYMCILIRDIHVASGHHRTQGFKMKAIS